MKHLTPQIIADVTGGEYVGENSSRHIRVSGAARDNRDVVPGNLFVCIRGARADGHGFANSAFGSGAACCLAERAIPGAKGPYVLTDSTLGALKTLGAYYRSLFDMPVIGITGSVGKTTSKEMAAAVLGAKLDVLKTPMNLNNEIGVPLTLLSLDERHEAAVIEMGISEFGEMGRLAEMVRPDVFVITKIGHSHLDNLGGLDGVLRAKTEAFAYMKPEGVAILNGDDELLWSYDPGIRKITYGFDPRNDYCAEKPRNHKLAIANAQRPTLNAQLSITLPAYGSHLAQAALAAVAIAGLFGLTAYEICRGVLAYEPAGSRAKLIDTGHITLVDDCYNANPESVAAALESLSTLPGRRVAVLGDMLGLGGHTEKAHRDIGILAASSAIESLICCGSHAELIYEGFLSAGGQAAKHFRTKEELMPELPGLVEKSDNVLVKASNAMRFDEIAEALKSLGRSN